MLRLVLLSLAAAVSAVPAYAADTLRVVATIPDLAELTRTVGGAHVEVTSIATGVEDIHAVSMKPSFAVQLNRADAVVLLGLEAEHAFLPGLLEASRNPKIQRDSPGYIDASVYVMPLEVPTRIDRALGDQHPMGNPHYNLDPLRMTDAARAVADGLARLDPEHDAEFHDNARRFQETIDAAMTRWQKAAAPLKGKKLVSYHPDLVYLADRFGMEPFGTIEIRAGIDPTPAHVSELEDAMRRAKVPIVVRERHYPAGLAETVAEATGAKLVELPVMVNGVPEAKDYAALIDYEIQQLVRAVTP